ncbi:lysophospholipid acyltransferase family protein [bacterium]|nr:lysophospholipid acyltransferase family protein [bacterium]
MQTAQTRLFSLVPGQKDNLKQKAVALAASVADHVLSFPKADRFYQELPECESDHGFCRGIIESLDLKIKVSENDLQRVPSGGPVVVVANHPFGLLDPIILYATLRELRPDIRVLANHMLSRVPELQSFCTFVDPFGGPGAERMNLAAMRSTLEWLRNGGMVVIFPAGEVAALTSRNWQVTEPNWNSACARLARLTEAQTLPVYFHGTNAPMFHLAGLVHPRLRTALLPHELLNKRNMEIRMAIGHPISGAELRELPGEEEAAAHLRRRTFNLRNRWKYTGVKPALLHSVEVAAHPRPDAVTIEVEALPAECVMTESNDVTVYCVEAKRIPETLLEIGRLREATFRLCGEGSGRDFDLDRFDPHYLHLFSWHRKDKRLIGAYRLGPTDRIMAMSKELYVSSLFKIQQSLLQHLTPALELGRSFVRPEYQKSPSALFMLWKGLAKFVMLNPQYNLLFGPVSISADYNQASTQMMIDFLAENCCDEKLAEFVRPRSPYQRIKLWPLTGRRPLETPHDLMSLSTLVADLESDGKGVPVLIREYLRLGGKILGFNVDRDFNHVVDGLILVNLLDTPERVLQRYMGNDGAAEFRQWHQKRLGLSKRSRKLAA